MKRLLGQTPSHDNPMNPTLQVILRQSAPTLPFMQQPSIVVRKRVGHLMVNGIISNLTRGIAHAQRNTEDVPDKEHDQRCPDDVPADDEKGADDLQPDLLAVAGDGSAGVGQAEGCAAGGCSKDAGANAADERADKVGVEDVEGIVDALE